MTEATATVSASSLRFETENYIKFRFSSCSVPIGEEQSAASTSHTPYRYIQFLKEIIENAPHKKVTLSIIYKDIIEMFPVYATAPPCWYAHVKEVLRHFDCFVEIHRISSDKDSERYWTIDPDYRESISCIHSVSQEVENAQRVPSYERPTCNYIKLIQMAIMSSSRSKMTWHQICDYVQDNFPYFIDCGFDWRKAINIALSRNDKFVKIVRKDKVNWHFWKMNPSLCYITGETYDSFNLRRPSRFIRGNEIRAPASIAPSETNFQTLNERPIEVNPVLNKNIATSSASKKSNSRKRANLINDSLPTLSNSLLASIPSIPFIPKLIPSTYESQDSTNNTVQCSSASVATQQYKPFKAPICQPITCIPEQYKKPSANYRESLDDEEDPFYTR
ncbi:forkhead box protein G1-like [Xenia sp. Carnegie-2017]|uniref:forkhead box protein G1-like n=1 Tax=Xenia sp. Carnegie-2017 TaxID=2897299 RepID=UPI001F046FE4|nr:forkhead box protein G1-like [Xenia sp. Carnegie-2017]